MAGLCYITAPDIFWTRSEGTRHPWLRPGPLTWRIGRKLNPPVLNRLYKDARHSLY